MKVSLEGCGRAKAMRRLTELVDGFIADRMRQLRTELLTHRNDLDLDVVDAILADVAARDAEARAATLAKVERIIAEHTSE